MRTKVGREKAKIIITGDLHLHDKPYHNSLDRSSSLLDSLLTISVKNGYCPIVLNGDIFHTPRPSFDTMMIFWNFLDRASIHKILVCINVGNHDYFSLTNPVESYLDLFQSFSNVSVANQAPSTIEIQDLNILVIPWRPGEMFLKLVNETVKRLDPERKTILVAHQPITEGVVNDSGIKVNQDLSIKDFKRERFKFVFLSDYHEYQELADNVWYIGAPMSTKHGEVEQHGVVGVFVGDDGAITWEHIPLPEEYSEFVTYDLGEGEDLYISDYDENNYNRIYVAATKKSEVELLYPSAQIIPKYETKQVQTRLREDDAKDATHVVKQFLKTRTYKNRKEAQVMKKLVAHFYKEARIKLSKEGR